MIQYNTDLLMQTKVCEACEGKGFHRISVSKTNKCDVCKGAGAIIDSVVPELIKKFCPDIKSIHLAELTTAIFGYYQDKVEESYDRGFEQGKNDNTK